MDPGLRLQVVICNWSHAKPRLSFSSPIFWIYKVYHPNNDLYAGLAKLTKYSPLVSNLKPQGATLSTTVIPDTPEILAKIEAAVVDFLSKKPSQDDTLAKVGIYLRGRNLIPQEGLKKFITNRPQLFTHLDE